MGILIYTLLLLSFTSCSAITGGDSKTISRRVIDVEGGPEDVIWVVQLSDLHFSVHHPERALDFKRLVGPALSIIRPSLVLLTGDLTDGKSEDLLTMKQNEEEWIEYQKVMEDVTTRSGLDKSIFYDLRGNHDNFGVPVLGGSLDFFSKYSISGQLGRRGSVNSVTLQTGEEKHLFVGFDSTMSIGLRGPTNLFGHPTDQLLTDIDSELSQWKNSQPTKPEIKISFGHFPLSFSAASNSGKSLKDIFIKHSISAYLCGHLHTRFGKNLKRHHQSGHQNSFFQSYIHQISSENTENCSKEGKTVEEFWEWEMGDWRKSKALRILAVDRGYVSFLDIDLKSEAKKPIILPTFPLDSRFMSTKSDLLKYKCNAIKPSYYEAVRALVFSVSTIVSVVARIYDSRSGNLDLVMESYMQKNEHNFSRGDLYIAPWNYKAFEDLSPDRYWLQIEANDIMGRSSLTELRPFSINGYSKKLSWTWREFFVMGCQWDALYYPMLWLSLLCIFSILLLPKALLIFTKKHSPNKEKGRVSNLAMVLTELDKLWVVWLSMMIYTFYLISFPWFSGQVFTDGGERGYMTYKGWVVNLVKERKNMEFIGSPDIMVVVLPHIIFVVLPAILVVGALAAERWIYRVRFLLLSGKKEDDYSWKTKRSLSVNRLYKGEMFCFGKRWIRKILLVVCLAICWKHFQNCRRLAKAYEMIPFLHFPVYSLWIPLFFAYAIYRTGKVQ